MAYDLGSQGLGIVNPFKQEGALKTGTGILILLFSLVPFLSVSSSLQENPVKAWAQIAVGLMLLTWGFRLLANGSVQLFRFYVGRSVPSSLAYNRAPSERENADSERQSGSLHYTAEKLESMLMGRKNTTYEEPIGWLARLVHSLVPNLILAPYPLRNAIQELVAVFASTLLALVAFGFSYFVCATGLAGQAGDFIINILSILLLLYLLNIWRLTANNLNTKKNRNLQGKSAAGISRLLAFALVAPVLLGYGYNLLLDTLSAKETATLEQLLQPFLLFNAWNNLLLLLVMVALISTPIFILLRERLAKTSRKTQVSEFRENMQESVHPNEIFINIENIVLGNRRYQEIPNRVYRDFEPKLQEQSQGKGTFKGQLLIETQPEFKPMNFSARFIKARLLGTLGAQVLTLIAAVLLYVVTLDGVGHIVTTHATHAANNTADISSISTALSSWLTLFFSMLTLSFSARILARICHLFWAELQFDSLLMSMKTEGTYTESKISTGMAFNDSTRSENIVVRSSITPWLLTSRITSSTYATSGLMNLEMPRLILEFNSNNTELDAIVTEIRTFLRCRETIASINNEKDLANADRIFQVNQISKSAPNSNSGLLVNQPETAGILQHQQHTPDEGMQGA